MPRNPDKTPCSIDGCRAWAIRGSDPPLCSPHRTRARREEHADPALDPGDPDEVGMADLIEACRDCPSLWSPPPGTPGHLPWAASAGRSRGVGAPPGNQNRRTHGFYARYLNPQEWADLEDLADGPTLDAEIAIARIALRRVLDLLFSGHTPGPEPAPLAASDVVRLTNLAIRGAGTVSRLLRTQQAMDLAVKEADDARSRCNIPCLIQLSLGSQEES